MACSTAHFNEIEGQQVPLERVSRRGERGGREVLINDVEVEEEVVGGRQGVCSGIFIS